jgi:uncharacterized protein
MRWFVSMAVALLIAVPVYGRERNKTKMNSEQAKHAIAALRAAYAAFNRGDIEAATRVLDKDVEWIEPLEFPGGGTYHGVEGAKLYLAQSRAAAAQVISEPERFYSAGDRIVVFVHARVLPKGGATWQDVRLADVYRFQLGKVIEMRSFANRKDALTCVGIDQNSAPLE